MRTRGDGEGGGEDGEKEAEDGHEEHLMLVLHAVHPVARERLGEEGKQVVGDEDADESCRG